MIVAPQLLLVRAAAVALVALLLVGVGAWLGYRQGAASGDRREAAQLRGERDVWRRLAEEGAVREREWLKRAGEVSVRWEGALETIDALQRERPKTVREVIREGSPCPVVSIDPATFGVLNAAVDAANAADRPAP
jgi:hypothetical protein